MKIEIGQSAPEFALFNTEKNKVSLSDYKGKNVVVGIIDIGFDYNHPSFYDGQGNCRIKRVWEQNKLGTPPTGYNYGN